MQHLKIAVLVMLMILFLASTATAQQDMFSGIVDSLIQYFSITGYAVNLEGCYSHCHGSHCGYPDCICPAEQGDCDSDNDCEGDLICCKDEDMPSYVNVGALYGCGTGFSYDICLTRAACDAITPTTTTTSTTIIPSTCTEKCNNVGYAHGECTDSYWIEDAHTCEGTTCRYNTHMESATGLDCNKKYCLCLDKDENCGDTHDYCTDRCDGTGGCQPCPYDCHPDRCSYPACICPSGVGDCDSNNDCESGLVCCIGVGEQYCTHNLDVCLSQEACDLAKACPSSSSSCSYPVQNVGCGSSLEGCLNAGDWKYYKVPNSAGKQVTVTLTHAGSGCHENDMFIYRDTCGNAIGRSTSNAWSDTWSGTPVTDIVIAIDGDSTNTNCQWALSVDCAGVSTTTTSTTVPIITTTTVQPGELVASWEFDEGQGITASDSSGNGNTGTLKNGPTWVTCDIGSALQFDGLNDYIECGNSASLTREMTAITVSAWIKDNGNAVHRHIVSDGRLYTGYGGFTFLITNQNKLVFIIDDGTSRSGRYVSYPMDGGWHHVVGKYDGSTVYTYIDGTEYSKTITETKLTKSSYPVYIGREGFTGRNYFNGIIDDINIWSRALTTSEVAAIYNQGIPCQITISTTTSTTTTTPPAPPGYFTLTVNKGGDGSGRVEDHSWGWGKIDCGSDCTTASANYEDGSGTRLNAHPELGSYFDHWEGACSGTNDWCDIKFDTAKTVTAFFSLAPVTDCSPGEVEVVLDGFKAYLDTKTDVISAPTGKQFTGGKITKLLATGDMYGDHKFFEVSIDDKYINGDYSTDRSNCVYQTLDTDVNINSYITGKDSFELRVASAYHSKPSSSGCTDSAIKVKFCLDLDTTSTVVATDEASDIQISSATLNGDLFNLGGASSADVWFRYGEGLTMPAVYDHCNRVTSAYAGGFDNVWFAQTFTPSVSYKLDKLKIKLARKGSPGNVIVAVRATDSNGHPTGSNLLAKTINGNSLVSISNSNGKWYDIVFSKAYTFSAGTKYAIEVKSPSGDSSNYARWAYTTGCNYEGGNYIAVIHYTDHDLYSFNDNEAADMMFEVWGTTYDETAKVTKTSTGTFTAPITGLAKDAIYNFRALAKTSNKIFYGDELQFIANPSPTTTTTTLPLEAQPFLWQLREHDIYAQTNYDPYYTFIKDGPSKLKIVSSHASMGRGNLFMYVPCDWLNGKYIRWKWDGYFGHSVKKVTSQFRLYDGAYDRTSNIDFPPNKGFKTKGAGILLARNGPETNGAWGPQTRDVLVDTSKATQEYCTIRFVNRDAWGSHNVNTVIGWVEINTGPGGSGNLYKEDFGDDDIVMEKTGTLADYGYYGAPKPPIIPTTTTTTTLPVCSDTDDGKDYYKKGEISGDMPPGFIAEDRCLQGNELRETYCDIEDENGDGYIGTAILYDCPNGCLGGACLVDADCPICGDNKCADSRILTQGEPISTEFCGEEYNVELVGVPSTDTVVMEVNSDMKSLQKEVATTVGGLKVYVDDIYFYGPTRTDNQAKVYLYENPTDCPDDCGEDCTDSDGIDYYTKGTAIDKDGKKYTDYCVDDTVIEHYCDPAGSGYILASEYLCLPDTCYDGACIWTYRPTYVFMRTDKYSYQLHEPVEISASAEGTQAALDELDLVARVIKPDTSTVDVEFTTRQCSCGGGGPGEGEAEAEAEGEVEAEQAYCTCTFSGAVFADTGDDGFYAVDGFNGNPHSNLTFTVVRQPFQVFDPAILGEYLILEDIGEYKYEAAAMGPPPYPYNGTSYAALYNKSGAMYQVIVVDFDTREELQDFIKYVIESEHMVVENYMIDGYQVYLIYPDYYSFPIVLWTNENILVFVSEIPTIKQIEPEPIEEIEEVEQAASSLMTSMVTGSVEEPVEPIQPSEPELPLPLITPYLEKYPSDLTAIGTECEDHGGYCTAADTCKSGYEQSGYACYESEICCVKEIPLPDLIELTMKLEAMKVQFNKMKDLANAISAYYEADGNIPQKIKFEDIDEMFDVALGKIDYIEQLIKDNIDDIPAVKKEIEHAINDLKAYLKEILLAILGTPTERYVLEHSISEYSFVNPEARTETLSGIGTILGFSTSDQELHTYVGVYDHNLDGKDYWVFVLKSDNKGTADKVVNQILALGYIQSAISGGSIVKETFNGQNFYVNRVFDYYKNDQRVLAVWSSDRYAVIIIKPNPVTNEPIPYSLVGAYLNKYPSSIV